MNKRFNKIKRKTGPRNIEELKTYRFSKDWIGLGQETSWMLSAERDSIMQFGMVIW